MTAPELLCRRYEALFYLLHLAVDGAGVDAVGESSVVIEYASVYHRHADVLL